VPDPLPDVNAIWHHLKASGAQSIIPAAYVAMQARIVDFDSLVHIQFRKARTVRVSVTLPIRILSALHTVYAVALREFDRTGLECSVVMSPIGIAVFAPIPFGDRGPLGPDGSTCARPVVARLTSVGCLPRDLEDGGSESG